jgi:hypothetical protein
LSSEPFFIAFLFYTFSIHRQDTTSKKLHRLQTEFDGGESIDVEQSTCGLPKLPSVNF